MAVTKTPQSPPDHKVTAMDLKLALLEYYRFKRQFIAIDECLNADIVADAGNHIIEVEVKISRSDLLKGEAVKAWKHQNYDLQFFGRFIPNKYYFCVPASLKDVAIEYAYGLNSKYGVLAWDPEFRNMAVVKSALLLHGGYSELHRHQIAKRASCKAITMMQNEHLRKSGNK